MRLIDADEFEGYLKAPGTDTNSLYSVDDLVRAVQNAPTVEVTGKKELAKQTYSVYITESKDCLADWTDESIPSIEFHDLTLEESILLLDICKRQYRPHNAVMTVEYVEWRGKPPK